MSQMLDLLETEYTKDSNEKGGQLVWPDGNF